MNFLEMILNSTSSLGSPIFNLLEKYESNYWLYYLIIGLFVVILGSFISGIFYLVWVLIG